jgi:ParB/RepB/Spo0J family partition protein
MKVREVPLEKIFVTKNVRFDTDEELGELIASTERMLLQPIGVYPRGERYELVWGHRRLRAAQANNEPTIAAHILENISESDIPIIKLQENMVRKQLTTEEVVAAADEIKKRRPELNDAAIDTLLGKRKGYLSYHRSTLKTYQWLASKGLKKEHLVAMTGDELRELRSKLEGSEKTADTRKHTFHRGERVPRAGFTILTPDGPNVVVVCSCCAEKRRVVNALRRLRGDRRAR